MRDTPHSTSIERPCAVSACLSPIPFNLQHTAHAPPPSHPLTPSTPLMPPHPPPLPPLPPHLHDQGEGAVPVRLPRPQPFVPRPRAAGANRDGRNGGEGEGGCGGGRGGCVCACAACRVRTACTAVAACWHTVDGQAAGRLAPHPLHCALKAGGAAPALQLCHPCRPVHLASAAGRGVRLIDAHGSCACTCSTHAPPARGWAHAAAWAMVWGAGAACASPGVPRRGVGCGRCGGERVGEACP